MFKSNYSIIAIAAYLLLGLWLAAAPGSPTVAPHPHHGSHGGVDNTSQVAKAGLFQLHSLFPATVTDGIDTPFLLAVTAADGTVVRDFDYVHEKLLHLIVVDHHLQFFNHLHPQLANDGQFSESIRFPVGGRYYLFADFQAKNYTGQVALAAVEVEGRPANPIQADFTREKKVGQTSIKLDDRSVIRADAEVQLVFTLSDDVTGQMVTDLVPYLGANGHLVIIKHAEVLSAKDYLHTHPHDGAQQGIVMFNTRFPEAGQYRLFAQFKRQDELLTADFWLDVL